MNGKHLLLLISLSALHSHALAEAPKTDVKITRDISQIEVMHQGKPVIIKRNQDTQNRINEVFSLTSRVCPPFCVQPMQLLPGVTTIAELEMLQFLKRASDKKEQVLVIDSRTPDWTAKGLIPGTINIPWTQLYRGSDIYEPFMIENLLTDQFGATVEEGIWDFRQAKELVFFCNGPWCGQSSTNIKTLVSMGYPAHKIFWYRGGMQSWYSLGFTTVKP